METLQQRIESRDYDAISPSAKSLLLLKGITNIPYAKETAALMSFPLTYVPDTGNKDFSFWKRVVHFEERYWSVDHLLTDLSITNMLEISSGYSFRGLATVQEKAVHYIDTDLPEVISKKKDFIVALQGDQPSPKGSLKMLDLNALDEDRFREIVRHFPPGSIIIVNEGLMMYLNTEEKEKLCEIIYGILRERGGYWITGDIYIKTTLERLNDGSEDSLKELIEQQGIEKNMFESLETAAAFLAKKGFVVEKEAVTEHAKISSLPYLIGSATPENMKELTTSLKKIRVTWRLKIDPEVG